MILDSNVLIYFVDPGYEQLRAYLDNQASELGISLITKLEVLGYHQLKPDDKIELEQLLAAVSVYPVSDRIITEAIRLRQQRKRSIGDSIIAATGLLYNQPILTNNVTDFVDVEGLQVIALSTILQV